MSTIRNLLLGALASASFALPALAQDTRPAAPPQTRAQGAEAAFKRIDTNNDGFVDKAEMRVWREATFARLDANKDGVLAGEELKRGRGNRPDVRPATTGADQNTQTPPAAPNGRFGRGDDQTTGPVTRAQFLANGDAAFDRRDANKDGRISLEEFRARGDRPAGRRPGSGER